MIGRIGLPNELPIGLFSTIVLEYSPAGVGVHSVIAFIPVDALKVPG